jgi:predicted O-methyltransferase YrrM
VKIPIPGVVTEMVFGARAWINNAVDARWNNDPFGTEPAAEASEYLALFEEARKRECREVDAIEAETGFAIEKAWLDDLALHTQIVKKKSVLTYPHGRLLYSLLRRYIKDSGHDFVTVLETGTARGFSALCMAKAISDARVDGRVVTLDVLPHMRKFYWNCIDDAEGRKSRAELLSPWADLTRKVLFVQGDTLLMLPRIGIDRVNFAFLDAQHIKSSVLNEHAQVAARQQPGDMIFFDDVTPAQYPGVVAAVQKVQDDGAYVLRRIISNQRGFAWGHKVRP